MRILLSDATIVNEDECYQGSVVIEGDRIAEILRKAPSNLLEKESSERVAAIEQKGNCDSCNDYDEIVDVAGCFLLPGVIDSHVHFREPGLTAKADMESESRAAAYGGVTTYFDMPNTVPQTTTLEALNDKFERAAGRSHVNYSFFFGATNDNAELFPLLDEHRVPGIKLFMGSSTGNMLVDDGERLENIFKSVQLPIVAHCEDSKMIARNMRQMQQQWGEDPDVCWHAHIRSAEACYESTRLAVDLARKYETRLHVAHLSTERELNLFGDCPNITAEAVIAHLFFSDGDYAEKGSLIKCNPAIKSSSDRAALRKALVSGKIATVATDHAPHLLSDKQGGCTRAASGMPMIQFSLVTMLELVDAGVLPIERMVELMSHRPATLFGVSERGFIRQGYKADLVVVRRERWKVTEGCIQSKCGWSPMTGHEYVWRVKHTFCNGRHLYNDGLFDENVSGEEVKFRIVDK